MLVFEERRKPEYQEKNLLEQSREPANSVYMTLGPGIEPRTHWWMASALATAPTLLCAMQIMLGTPPDIYTSALTNTKILQSGGILSNMAY